MQIGVGMLQIDVYKRQDAIIGSMLICEMAAYYRSIGSSIKQRLEEIYEKYGRYLNKVDSFEFPGLSGMDKMAGIMDGLRQLSLIHIWESVCPARQKIRFWPESAPVSWTPCRSSAPAPCLYRGF